MNRDQSNTRGLGRDRGMSGRRAQVNTYYPPLTKSLKPKVDNYQLLIEGSSHKCDDKNDDSYTIVQSKKSIKLALVAKPKLNYTELNILSAYSSIMTLDYKYFNWMTGLYYIAKRFMMLDKTFLFSGNKDREYYEKYSD